MSRMRERRIDMATMGWFLCAGGCLLTAGVPTAHAGGPSLVTDRGQVCPLWDNGLFDDVDGQASMLLTPMNETVPTVDARTADDFSLEPGYVHRVDRVTGTLFSTSVIAGAKLEIYADCNGGPGALLFEAPATRIETGPAFGAATQYIPNFDALNLWLPAGQYWLSIIGTGEDPAGPPAPTDPEYYWGSTDHVKGAVARFKSVSGGKVNWTPVDQLTIPGSPARCRDFNFRLFGRSCKTIHDGGLFDIAYTAGAIGALSIVNDSFTAMDVRSADQFVTNPCRDQELCYIEAYVFSNCPSARIELYEQSCQLPGTLVRSFTPVVTDLGDVVIGGKSLNILKLQVFQNAQNPDLSGVILHRNSTYWISAFGVGDGSLNGAIAYFARGQRCDKPSNCQITYTPGVMKGPRISRTTWTDVQQIAGSAMDFAFSVSVRDDGAIPGSPAMQVAAECIADVNQSGAVNVADLFLFLDEWFTGCP